jgi:hypothetical protein
MEKTVGIAQSVQWLGQRLGVRGIVVRFLRRVRVFSLFQNIQTRSGAHPAWYPVDTRIPVSITKRPRRGADPSLPSSTEVKNGWRYTSNPFMHSYLSDLTRRGLKVQLRVRVDLPNAEKDRGVHQTEGRAGATGADVKRETPDYEGDQTPAYRPMC